MKGLAAFLDTETTGLSNEDEAIELAIALFEFDTKAEKTIKVVDHYSGLREPSCEIGVGAARVHGISWGDVAGKRLKDRAVKRILRDSQFLIAHNAPFDRRFVKKLYPQTEKMSWHCSMNGINWKAKGFSSKGLQQLLQAHDIEVRHGHRAYADVMAALELLGMRDMKTGQPYLAELLGIVYQAPPKKKKGCLGTTLKIVGYFILAVVVLGILAAIVGPS